MVSARFLRLLPHDFQNGIYLRLEIMGCREGYYILNNSTWKTWLFYFFILTCSYLLHPGYQWLTTPPPPLSPVSPGGSCREKEFLCENGRCVPADALSALCDGVDDCGDGSDERYCGRIPTLSRMMKELCSLVKTRKISAATKMLTSTTHPNVCNVSNKILDYGFYYQVWLQQWRTCVLFCILLIAKAVYSHWLFERFFIIII